MPRETLPDRASDSGPDWTERDAREAWPWWPDEIEEKEAEECPLDPV